MRYLLILVFSQIVFYNSFSQSWKDVKTYDKNTIALKEDGSLWGWGVNYYGEMGTYYEILNTNSIKYPRQIGREISWDKIAVGEYFTLALKKNGTLWAFGRNNYGQLGVGSQLNNTNEPVQIGTDSDWTSIAVGDEHSLALKKDGTVWSWGRNDSGQLGLGNFENRPYPTQITIAFSVSEIYAKSDFSFLKTENGTLYSFGENASGQLATADYLTKNTPTLVAGLKLFNELFCGNSFVFGLTNFNTIYCWGSNQGNILSTNGTYFSNKNIPFDFNNNSFVSISGGSQHVLAIKNNKSLWSWGNNSFGQLGNNSTNSNSFPTQVGNNTNWTKISVGKNHSFAINELGELWVCGSNYSSNLGDQTNVDKHVLVKLDCPETQYLEMTFFPNPVNDIFNFNFQANSLVTLVKVYDLYGTLRVEKQFPGKQIDLSHLNTGLFVIDFLVDGLHYQHKIMKK